MGLIRATDTSSHGGHLEAASGGFNVGGIQVAVNQDMHICPIPGHGITPVTGTSTTVFSAGKSVLRNGDIAGCGAMMISTETTVNAG